MTLDEFTALKEGDQIQSMTGDVGTVVKVDKPPRGFNVMLQWGDNASFQCAFGLYQSAWMHWTKIENVTSESDASGERTN